MVQFAANLSMMFNEVDFFDRFTAAREAGFKGVEFLFPYDFDKQDLVDALQSNNLTQVLHNLPPGDWAAGERSIATMADRVDEHGQLEGVCAETLPRDSLEYYLTRPKEKGNVYGQVAMLWCIVALL